MGSVIVVGSLNVDAVATVAALPVPGETVAASKLAWTPGGKGANQAVAAGRSGVPTVMVGRVGDGPFGELLRMFLSQAGVDVSRVVSTAGVGTGAAIVVVDAQGENTVVVGAGANAQLSLPDVVDLPIRRGDVVVTQLEIPFATALHAVNTAHHADSTTILNATPVDAVARSVLAPLLRLVDLLVVNESELSVLGDRVVDADTPVDEVLSAARAVRAWDGQTVVVTLGARGLVALQGDGRVHVVAAPEATVVDTTGAGDCFTGWLAAGLAENLPLDRALRRAVTAAALCVGQAGAGPSMPTLAAVLAAQT